MNLEKTQKKKKNGILYFPKPYWVIPHNTYLGGIWKDKLHLSLAEPLLAHYTTAPDGDRPRLYLPFNIPQCAILQFPASNSATSSLQHERYMIHFFLFFAVRK